MAFGSTNALEIDLDHAPPGVVKGLRIAFGIMGGVALALGIALLVWPGRTLAVGVALVAVYLLLAGVLRVTMGVLAGGLAAGLRALAIGLGLLMSLAAVVMLRNLEASTAVLLLIATITVGFGWIVDGIMGILESRRAGSGAGAIAFGVVGILAGVAVIAFPGISVTVFLWINAVVLILLGVLGLVRAFTFGRAARV